MSEKYKHRNPARMELVHQTIDELRELKKQGEFTPTADIDMVWVLSALGTYFDQSEDGIYNGELADKINIDAGVELVRKITALRLNKPVEQVTKEDVEAHGPVMFYNGEDKETKNVNYLQNEALEKAASQPDFPIPKSKIVIDHIDTIATPAQVIGIANYLAEHEFRGKIAVVSMVHHSARVGRYIEHYKQLLPDGITMVNAFIPETVNKVGKTLREVRKVADYAAKGDLATKTYFSGPNRASLSLGERDPDQTAENMSTQG